MENKITSATTVVVNTFDWVWRGNLATPLGQFVENPKWRRIKEETTALSDRLLLEKIPLAGIARAVEVSEPWSWWLFLSWFRGVD